MMRNLVIISVGVLLLGGLAMTVGLIRQRQQLSNQAAVSSGQAEMFLEPQTANLAAGQELSVRVVVSTGSVFISAITAQLDYEFNGSVVPTIEAIEGNTVELIPNNNWNYPFKLNDTSARSIKIAAVNTGINGHQFQGETTLALLRIKTYSPGLLTVRFNSTNSKIIAKQTGLDILVIPTSVGLYTITDTTPTISPVPSLTPIPDPTDASMTFSFRFEGVTSKRADKTVKLIFKPVDGGADIVNDEVLVTANEAGIYSGAVNNVPSGQYQVLLKGPSHLQKLFTNVQLNSGQNTINWSTRQADQLLIGDVNDTNSISIEDVARILVLYIDFKIPVDATKQEDVNFDGFMTLDDVALTLLNYTDFEVRGDN